jgi:DNA-binding GntR family transcriptional regulator
MNAGVAARLRGVVFDGELAAGSFIGEKVPADAWQVRRTPLREALKVRAGDGRWQLVPHRGFRVIELTEAEADVRLPVMALLEGRCAFGLHRQARCPSRTGPARPCPASASASRRSTASATASRACAA